VKGYVINNPYTVIGAVAVAGAAIAGAIFWFGRRKS
jgi:hypothetical protein